MTRKEGQGPDMDRRQMMGALAGAAVAIAAPVASVRAATPAAGPVGDTAYGKILGVDRSGIKVFSGVPYGADTSGANRWLPPKPPAKWTGVKDCLAYGPLPPQSTPLVAPLKEEGQMAQQEPVGEDCLKFNLYTPAVGRNSGRRPVMVWFHGGGYFGGSGNSVSYDGTNLARKQDVVVISVTHRLGIFGFLYLGDLFGEAYADSGNVSMLDCVAVLKWIKANIANFGGDPNRVMCFGQSGGGAKVSTLLGMPAAKGLVHRAACISGAEFPPPSTREAAAARAKKVVDALGVKTMAELQALPWKQILDIGGRANPGPLGYMPVVDGRNLPAPAFNPVSPLQRDVPLIVSTTETESASWGASLNPMDDAGLLAQSTRSTGLSKEDATALIGIFKTAYPGLDNAYIGQLLSSQWSFNHNSIDQAERKAGAGGAPVHFLYFKLHGTLREGRVHSPHTADIPYYFDSLEAAAIGVGPVTPTKQAVADKLSTYWANFAKTGDPNGTGVPRWEPFTLANRTAMVVGTDGALATANDPWGTTRKAIEEFRPKAKPGPFAF